MKKKEIKKLSEEIAEAIIELGNELIDEFEISVNDNKKIELDTVFFKAKLMAKVIEYKLKNKGYETN